MVSTPMLPGTDPKATDDSVEESAAAETTPLASPTTPAPSSEDSKKPGSPKGFLAVLVLAFLASVAAAWWHDEVLSVAVPLCESIKELSDPVKMAVIGGALIVESVIPVPLYGITLLASGFVLGFPLAFLTVYPATIIGSTLMFLLSRNCCLGSARAVIESRRNLKAIGDAISFGGLKLMILIRVAPTPVFWATVVFATVEAPLSHFLITYALVNLKYALYCYIGSAAENLMAAMRSGDCDAEGGGGDCDAVLPESSGSGGSEAGAGLSGADAANMKLIISCVGVAAGIVALAVVGVYTKRELAKAGAHQQGSEPIPSDDTEEEEQEQEQKQPGEESVEVP